MGVETTADKGGQPVSEKGLPVRASMFLRPVVVGRATALIFAVVVLMLSLLTASNPTVVRPNQDQASGSGELTHKEAVEYYLPYPGVLPDSPLYKLKMVRDKAVLMITRDPLKKAEKELLYADKRINAALVLIEGGKVNLGVSTATKAEKYLQQSADRVIGVQKQGTDVKSWILKLQTARDKHEEIVRNLVQRSEGGDRLVLERVLGEIEMTGERLNQAFLDSK